MYVTYKKHEAEKWYLVIERAEDEICILVDFPFAEGITKQLKIWGNIDNFIIVEKRRMKIN